MANEDMNTMLIKLKERYRYSFIVLKEMVRTDFKLRYQGSFLGIAWSVLKPLMLFCVMYVVFVKFLKFTDGTPTFPLVLLLGISLWNFFAEATNMGLTAIVGRGDILRKIHFPNYIIVVSATVGALISLAINMCVVLVFCIFNQVHFTWNVLWLPLNFKRLGFSVTGLSQIHQLGMVMHHDGSLRLAGMVVDNSLKVVFGRDDAVQLSSGEQRLALLARAFVKDPELLILDEPLHGLDTYNRRRVKKVIEAFCQRKDKTMIMVTHYESELPGTITDRIFLKRN